jgi:exoribonuclease R
LYGRKPEGWVVKIIVANQYPYMSALNDNRHGVSVMQPADAKIAAEILIPKKFSAGARAGDQVIVTKITRWPKAGSPAEGRIIEILAMPARRVWMC